jgi:hypothetical protein
MLDRAVQYYGKLEITKNGVCYEIAIWNIMPCDSYQ